MLYSSKNNYGIVQGTRLIAFVSFTVDESDFLRLGASSFMSPSPLSNIRIMGFVFINLTQMLPISIYFLYAPLTLRLSSDE